MKTNLWGANDCKINHNNFIGALFSRDIFIMQDTRIGLDKERRDCWNVWHASGMQRPSIYHVRFTHLTQIPLFSSN